MSWTVVIFAVVAAGVAVKFAPVLTSLFTGFEAGC